MDLSWIQVGILLVIVSFVQGLGYAVATWFFNRKMEKHLKNIEEKLKWKRM